ncbi:MAG: hypothetical protein IID44_16780 [Planctomycetes bacterium]|nr:hypothetical protein [Planctomycetota bacterium]
MLTGEPIIQYLNTDLDLIASFPLDDLAAALEALGVFPLHATLGDDGLWWSTHESENDPTEPESNIAEILTAIEALPTAAMKMWNECEKREFNVGYDCGDEPWAFNQGLSNETLRRMAQCGLTLRWTLYPFRRDDSVEPTPNS